MSNMSTIERIYNALSAMGYKSRIEFIDDNNNHELRIYTDKEMKEEEKKEIRINLPEEIWDSIDTVTLTRLFQEELVVEKQKEGEVEEE